MEILLQYESWGLIILTTGMLGIRYYFSDFLKSEEPYNSNHILYLMCFSVFVSVSIIAVFVVYYSWNVVEPMTLTGEFVELVILIPRILFYSVACYFIYWVLKIFQGAQQYVVEMKKHYDDQIDEINNMGDEE